MGKKNRGFPAAKKSSLAAQKPVSRQPLVAESASEFWDELCKESPVRNQLDDCSLFPALSSNSVPGAESKSQKSGTENLHLNSPSISETLGDFDTVSEGSSDKICSVKEGTKVESVTAPKATKAPWVNLFKDNRKPNESLALHVFDNLPKRVTFEADDEDDLDMEWGYCLIGYFAGRFPGKKALLNLCISWNVDYQYLPHSSGWLVFKFKTQSSREQVLNGGPYFVFGRPLLLKNMPDYFRFNDEEISFMPVWVTLPGLPLAFWNPKGLGKIASKIGKPISMDNLTSTKERISYARVLIEVDASKELVKSVEVCLPNGTVYDQTVIFEHEPKFCTSCRIFGHSRTSCIKYDKALEEAYYKNQQDAAISENQPVKGNVVPSVVPETGTKEQPDVPESGTEVQFHEPESGAEVQPEVPEAGTDVQPDVPKSGTKLLPNVTVPQPNSLPVTAIADCVSKHKQPQSVKISVPGQGKSLDSEGDDGFIRVDRKKKLSAAQKGKQKACGQQYNIGTKGHSSRSNIDRETSKMGRSFDSPVKQGQPSISLDKSKGRTLPLSS